MSKDYLLLFLEKRIFTLGSADDALLLKLRASVDTVVSTIKNDLPLTLPYTLAALDPETPVDDPVLVSVAAAVQRQWNTYTEIFTEPRTVFRAIILDALARLVEEKSEIAGAIDLIARNILPHVQSGGETEILTGFRDRMREISRVEAEDRWPTSGNVVTPKLPSIKFGQLGGSSTTVDREALRAGFPQPSWNNQHWINIGQQLLDVTKNQGVEAIAGAIETAAKNGGISSDDLKKNLTEPLQKSLKELVDSVATSLASATAPIATLKKQGDLLWWKEAAFSENLEQSYRIVPAVLLPLAFALDFAALLPEWNPVAVERFLTEAFWVQSASGTTKNKGTKANLAAYLDELKANERTSQLLAQLPVTSQASSGRSTLLAFLCEFADGKTDMKALLRRTGLPPKLVIADWEICLYFFREIQALRLLDAGQNGDAE